MNQKEGKAGTGRVVLIFLLITALFISCEKYTFNPPAVDPDYEWKLTEDIQPVFNAKCATTSCHGGPTSPNLSEGKSFNALHRGGFVDLPAETSRLYTTITGSGHMARSSQAEKLKILYWIEQGAQDN